MYLKNHTDQEDDGIWKSVKEWGWKSNCSWNDQLEQAEMTGLAQEAAKLDVFIHTQSLV